jgi:ABC-type dipeptide/oligopeptide/nickel transport system permease subunit
MKTKKNYWDMIIGFLIGIFPLTELFTDVFHLFNNVILYIPRRIVYAAVDCWFCTTAIIFIFFLSVIQWTLLISVITNLVKKINSK